MSEIKKTGEKDNITLQIIRRRLKIEHQALGIALRNLAGALHNAKVDQEELKEISPYILERFEEITEMIHRYNELLVLIDLTKEEGES